MTGGRRDRVAIIGCGAVAQEMHAPALKALGPFGTRVVAVSDHDEARARTVATELGAPVLPLDRALEAANLAIVATPPRSHFELVASALAASCDVLCEKPFVLDRKEASELVKQAAGGGRELFVGHFRRLYASLRTARALLATGAVGPALSVEAYEGGRFNWRARSQYTTADPTGGVLYDTGSHLLDMILFALKLDSPDLTVSVEGAEREPQTNPAHEFRASAVVADGDAELQMRIHLSRYEALANLIRVRCEHGTVEIPAGPGSGVRLRGPDETTLVSAGEGEHSVSGAFVEQLRMVTAGEDASVLAASGFVGLTHLLAELEGAGARVG